MPIYEYRCAGCGHIMEVWAKMSDPPPAACEKCQAAPLEKLISRSAFQLKGGGWYKQGYSGSSGKSSSASDGGSPGGDSTSTPSTPAATTSTPASTPSSAPSSGGSGPSST